MRRPGYLAGYQAFGKAKGMVAQTPSPPPAEALQAPAQPSAQAPMLRPLPPPQPVVGPSPVARRPADPAVVARIEALQARVRGPVVPARPVAARPGVPARPMPRPPVRPVADDDDEDED